MTWDPGLSRTESGSLIELGRAGTDADEWFRVGQRVAGGTGEVDGHRLVTGAGAGGDDVGYDRGHIEPKKENEMVAVPFFYHGLKRITRKR